MKRIQFLMIRASEEEKTIANAKAQDMDMNLSAFVRFLIRQWNSPDIHLENCYFAGLSSNTPDKPQNQREGWLWVIPEFLYALYLKITRR